MNHNSTSYTREIRLRTMVLRILEHWRSILVVALLAALLGAFYQYHKLSSAISASDREQAQEQYEKDLAAYETDRDSYQKTIKKVRTDLQSKREYLNESILAEIDPYAEAVAQFDIFLAAGEEEQGELTLIAAEYRAFLANEIDWSMLSEETGMEARFLQELVYVSEQNGVIHVFVRHIDTERAGRIAAYMLEQLPEKQKEIEQRGTGIEAQIGEVSTAVIADSQMFTWLNTRISEINNLQTNLSKTEDAAQKLARPAIPAGLARSQVAKSVLKYAAAGLVGGCVLMAILYALWLTVRNRVLSAEELNRTFGLRSIMVLPEKKKRSGAIDRMLSGRDRELGYYASDEERLNAMRRNIRRYAGDAEQILMTGSVPAARLEEMANVCGKGETAIRFTACDHTDEIALRDALSQADGVILVEEKLRSDYASIDRDIALLRDWGVEIIGSICIY